MALKALCPYICFLKDNPPPDERDEDPNLLPSVGSSHGVAEQPICPEIINTETQAGATGIIFLSCIINHTNTPLVPN